MTPLFPARPLLVSLGVLILAFFGGGCDSAPPSSPSPGRATGDTGDLIDGFAVIYGAQSGDAASAIVVGDFNGDGVQDVIVGASLADGPGDARPDAGEVYFFPGPFRPGDQRDAANKDQSLTVYGAHAGDQLARAMAAGDVNGDGVDDIVLGAPNSDGPAGDRPDAGAVYILLGSTMLGAGSRELDLAQEGADAVIYGADSQDLAGYAVLAEDVSGESTDDVIIGALWGDGPDEERPDSGEVYVVAGSSALAGPHDLRSERPDVSVYANAGDRLGEELGAGDVNGDGRQDLVLPATFATSAKGQGEAAGQTYVILAPAQSQVDAALGQQDLTIYGVDAGDQLGHSLGTGDANGDGFADILLAAVSSNGSANQARLAGEATLVLGRGLSAAKDPQVVDVAAGGAELIIYGAGAGDRLGRSSAVGDVNGDGLADLLVAAPGAEGKNAERSNTGQIYIILGAKAFPPIVELRRGDADAAIEGVDAEDTLGSEVAGRPALLVGDIDGDGRGDVLAGAPRGDGPTGARTDAGEAYIFFATGPP